MVLVKIKSLFRNLKTLLLQLIQQKKLAKTAGVSTDTYSKGKKILDSDNEKLKKEVLSGEKTINAGYKELQNENKMQINVSSMNP